jgi:TolB-like protein
MKKSNLIILILIILCWAVSAFAQLKSTVAVMNFNVTEGLSAGESLTLTNSFRNALNKTEKFSVMPLDKMRDILQTQEYNKGCSSIECALEAGKELTVEKIIIGDIGKVEDTYTINVQLVNVSSRQVEKSEGEKYVGSRAGLIEVVERLAQKIAGVYKEKRSYTWWYIGGAALVGGGAAAYFLMQPEEAQKAAGLPLPPDPPNQ